MISGRLNSEDTALEGFSACFGCGFIGTRWDLGVLIDDYHGGHFFRFLCGQRCLERLERKGWKPVVVLPEPDVHLGRS